MSLPAAAGRRAAIERAVRAVASALLAREITIAEAVSAVALAVGVPKDETSTPRERAAAGRRRHRANILAQMKRLEREGKGRQAAAFLARSNAADPLDPIEVETLENKYRRWRREEEKRAYARLPEATRCKTGSP